MNNKTIFVFVLAVLLISSVSASLQITLTQDTSNAVLTLADTTGEDYDRVEVPFTCSGGELSVGEGLPDFLNDLLAENSADVDCDFIGTEGTFSFYISDFVENLNFQADFNDGQTYPEVSSFSIDGDNMKLYIDSDELHGPLSLTLLLSMTGSYNIEDLTPTFLTDLIQEYNTNTQPMVGDASLTKSGNVYTFNYNKGFGENAEQYLTEIEKYVTLYVANTFSSTDLVDIPTELIELSDYEVSVNVDLSNLKLVDGTYIIPVTLSLDEEVVGTENVELTLSGLPEHAIPYVPSNPTVLDWVSQIANLPLGSNVVVALLGVSDVYPISATIKFLQAMEITVDQTTDGNIYFKVDKTLVSDPSKVSLYVLEGINWVKLTTTYLSDNGVEYEYMSYTSHFSTFMMGEDISAAIDGGSSSRRNGDGGGIVDSGTPETTNLGNTNPGPVTTNQPSPITGGIIGALKSAGGVVVLVFLIGITATAITIQVVKKRRVSA